MSKLNLDRDKVESCRLLAEKLIKPLQDSIDRHTTVSIERATLRLLGVEELYKGRSLANVVIDTLTPEELSKGIFYWIGRALLNQRSSNQSALISLCLRIAEKRLNFRDLPEADSEAIHEATEPIARFAMRRLEEAAQKARQSRNAFGRRSSLPLKYVCIGTNDFAEDNERIQLSIENGADGIWIGHSTTQGAQEDLAFENTQEVSSSNSSGTWITYKNLERLKKVVEEAGKKHERHVYFAHDYFGLCLPEVSVISALQGVDHLVSDLLVPAFSHGISLPRSMTDHYFARLIAAHSGMEMYAGNEPQDTGAHRSLHRKLATYFLNEKAGSSAHLQESAIGFVHNFRPEGGVEDSFLHEIAQAEMLREVFRSSPLLYKMSSSKEAKDIFEMQTLEGLFVLVSQMTQQTSQVFETDIGNSSLIQNYFMSLKSPQFLAKAARDLGDEISWSENGKVIRWARSLLEDTHRFLQKVEKTGLLKALAHGMFTVRCHIEGGKGGEGVLRKDAHYWNPLLHLLEKKPSAQEGGHEDFFERGQRARGPRKVEAGRYRRQRRSSNKRPRREGQPKVAAPTENSGGSSS